MGCLLVADRLDQHPIRTVVSRLGDAGAVVGRSRRFILKMMQADRIPYGFELLLQVANFCRVVVEDVPGFPGIIQQMIELAGGRTDFWSDYLWGREAAGTSAFDIFPRSAPQRKNPGDRVVDQQASWLAAAA